MTMTARLYRNKDGDWVLVREVRTTTGREFRHEVMLDRHEATAYVYGDGMRLAASRIAMKFPGVEFTTIERSED